MIIIINVDDVHTPYLPLADCLVNRLELDYVLPGFILATRCDGAEITSQDICHCCTCTTTMYRCLICSETVVWAKIGRHCAVTDAPLIFRCTRIEVFGEWLMCEQQAMHE